MLLLLSPMFQRVVFCVRVNVNVCECFLTDECIVARHAAVAYGFVCACLYMDAWRILRIPSVC